MNVSQQSLLGLLYIVLGIVLFLLAAGELLLRLAVIILSLWLISYGMRLRGSGALNAAYWHWRNKK